MATSNAWKVSFAKVPLGSYMMPQRRKVRTDGERFQVLNTRSLPLPYGDSFDSWVKEMTDIVATMEDVSVDYENANEEYSTEINAHGWVDASPEQLAVLKDHNFA